MTSERFQKLLEELDSNSVQTLLEKNSRYSQNGDALHNFRKGGEIFGGTPAQACWGYLTKHLVALRDKVQRNDFSDREDLLEKCQDIINYVRFIWCIGNEERESGTVKKKSTEPFFVCKRCGMKIHLIHGEDLWLNVYGLAMHAVLCATDEEREEWEQKDFSLEDIIDYMFAKED